MTKLVQAPEEIAGTVFPVFVEAADDEEPDDRVTPPAHVEERGAELSDDELSKLPY